MTKIKIGHNYQCYLLKECCTVTSLSPVALKKGGEEGFQLYQVRRQRRHWTCCTVTSLSPVAFCKGGEEGFQQSKEEEKQAKEVC